MQGRSPGKPAPPGFSSRGAGGASPRQNKPKISPFPLGRGSGGWGQKSTDTAEKASAAQVQPRGCKGRSPLHKKAKNLPLPRREERSASAGRGDGGRKALTWQKIASAARVQSRECKGRSPLHKKTKNLPLPHGEGGRGDGAKRQTKGKVGRRQRRQAPAGLRNASLFCFT